MSVEYGGKLLMGLKFWDANGQVILECGMIDQPGYDERNPSLYFKEFKLEREERIIGFKSDLDCHRKGRHYNFELVIGDNPTKYVLLKLYLNRKVVI